MRKNAQPSREGFARLIALPRLSMKILALFAIAVFLGSLHQSVSQAAPSAESRIIRTHNTRGAWLIEAADCITRAETIMPWGYSQLVQIVPYLDEDCVAELTTLMRKTASMIDYPHDIIEPLVRAQAKADMYNEAIESALMLQDSYRRHETLDIVVEEMAKAGQYDAVSMVLEKYENIWDKSEAVAKLVEIQAEAGDFAGALKHALTIEVEKYKIRAFISVALAQFAAGKTEDCEKTFDEAQSVARAMKEDSSESYAALAKAEAKAGLLERAWACVHQTNHKTYPLYAIIDVYIDRKSYGQARQTAHSLGHVSDRLSGLFKVARAMVQDGMKDDAREVTDEALNLLLQKGKDISSGDKHHYLLGIGTLQYQVGQHLNAAETLDEAWEGAMKFDRWVEDVAVACVKYSDWERVVSDVVEIGSLTKRERTMKRIVEELLKAGNFDEAELAADQMRPWNWASNVYYAIVLALVEAGRLDRARLVADKIHNPTTAVMGYAAVAQAHGAAGDRDRAMALFDDAIRFMSMAADKFNTFGGGLRRVIGGMAQCGMFEEAWGLVDMYQCYAVDVIAEYMVLKGCDGYLLDKHFARLSDKSEWVCAAYCLGVVRGMAQVQLAAQNKP